MSEMIKLFGMGMVFLSAHGIARGLAAKEKAAVAQIEGFLALFGAIRRGILYYRAPISDILHQCEVHILRACSGGETILHCDSLGALAEQCQFQAKELGDLVARAASELGRSLGEGEVALCDRYLAELSELCRVHTAAAREKSRLLGTLLYAAAAGVVILLM